MKSGDLVVILDGRPMPNAARDYVGCTARVTRRVLLGDGYYCRLDICGKFLVHESCLAPKRHYAQVPGDWAVITHLLGKDIRHARI